MTGDRAPEGRKKTARTVLPPLPGLIACMVGVCPVVPLADSLHHRLISAGPPGRKTMRRAEQRLARLWSYSAATSPRGSLLKDGHQTGPGRFLRVQKAAGRWVVARCRPAVRWGWGTRIRGGRIHLPCLGSFAVGSSIGVLFSGCGAPCITTRSRDRRSWSQGRRKRTTRSWSRCLWRGARCRGF